MNCNTELGLISNVKDSYCHSGTARWQDGRSDGEGQRRTISGLVIKVTNDIPSLYSLVKYMAQYALLYYASLPLFL